MISSAWIRAALGTGAFVLPLLLLAALDPAERTGADGVAAARNRYLGAKACKNCHQSEAKGSQYETWEQSSHAKAFDQLASPKAKEIASKLGIDNPQKSDKCLKCHVTAHGVKKNQIKRGFDETMGVQCESCHGPGEQHAKARFAAASSGEADPDSLTAVPAGEIISQPPVKTCLGCHNEDSPTFKPFCFFERWEKIAHFDPRKKRTEEELEAMKCQCGEDCKCQKAECGGPGMEAKKKKD